MMHVASKSTVGFAFPTTSYRIFIDRCKQRLLACDIIRNWTACLWQLLMRSSASKCSLQLMLGITRVDHSDLRAGRN